MKETKLEEIIVGRIEPKIYAFTTDTIPKYLKVGDTYREVAVRLGEWEKVFGKDKIVKEGEWSAAIDDNLYFRDYSVHSYLINHGKNRLNETDFPNAPYSNEFFKNATPKDVDDAIEDIKTSTADIYHFLDRNTKQIIVETYTRGDDWELRKPLQTDAEAKFKRAREKGYKDLLMYAVMRFGKSFTALCCAKEMNAKKVLVVSGKADVKNEWKQNTEIPGQFKEYTFYDSKALTQQAIGDKKAVIFVTLQDLADIKKNKFAELRNMEIDLMIIDETHFGARAEHYGKVIKSAKYKEDTALKQIEKDSKKEDSLSSIEDKDANKIIEECGLNVNIKLHLSGTPYKIIMNGEFKEEQIISFCQYTDILNEQKKWYDENVKPTEKGEPTKEEWENPYYGFPRMVRFAFNLNSSAQARLKALEQEGYEYKLSALFEPKSIEKDENSLYKTFTYEKEVLDFLKVIGGVEKDENILSFLDNERIKNGKLCRHIVMVLPYCASCDAMQNLIENNIDTLGKLKEYRIINVSGLDNGYKKIEQVKTDITKTENGKYLNGEITKTITLTVNKMLTGCTVPEWDTMIYLKDTASPQEYDQAIFRLQSQYIETYKDSEGRVLKKDLKPQTLLVDFEPNRMFYLQEEKSKIYNINTDQRGSDKIEDRIECELEDSPIIAIDGHKLVKVEPNDIMKAVSDYSVNKSITDEANKLSVDGSLFNDEKIRKIIDSEFEINSTKGINHEAYSGDETDFDEPDDFTEKSKETEDKTTQKNTGEENKQLSEREVFAKKFKSYYRRILFFAFLSKGNEIRSLQSVIDNLNVGENERIAKNLGLNVDFLKYFKKVVDGYVLLDIDGKIYNLYRLSHDYAKNPEISTIQRARTAINNFGKLSESEVVTPHNIAKQMIDLLPESSFIEVAENNNKKFLDIASKMGEFATAIVERAISLGIKEEDYKNSICSICTSPIAYEFTRFIYEALGLNIENIANVKLTSYDLLEVKDGDNLDYDKIVKLLSQNKKFNEIKKEDNPKEGENEVKFEAVVGNPPYQETTIDTSDNPIYHKFLNAGYSVAKKACFITPAKFLFNVGKTPKEWNKKMLSDEHLMVAMCEMDCTKIFSESKFEGGVVITYRDVESKFGKIGTFTPFPLLTKICNKVINASNFSSLSSIVYPQNKFNLEELYKDYPSLKEKIGSKGKEKRLTTSIFETVDIFTTEAKSDDDISILGLIGNNRVRRFIHNKYLEKHKNLKAYKIAIPKSNGSGAIGKVVPTPLIGEPVVLSPNNGFTQSFISMGIFDSCEEANAILKYVKSKFARTLLGVLKATQDNNKDTWEYVPLQDFTANSDIDWSKSIPEIDQQLYAKYNLTEEEISFIESMIKPME